MTRDEFRTMLETSGVHLWYVSCNQDWTDFLACLERFAAIVAAAEREACVQTLERLIGGDGIVAEDGVWVHDCVAALRARGAAPKAKP